MNKRWMGRVVIALAMILPITPSMATPDVSPVPVTTRAPGTSGRVTHTARHASMAPGQWAPASHPATAFSRQEPSRHVAVPVPNPMRLRHSKFLPPMAVKDATACHENTPGSKKDTLAIATLPPTALVPRRDVHADSSPSVSAFSVTGQAARTCGERSPQPINSP